MKIRQLNESVEPTLYCIVGVTNNGKRQWWNVTDGWVTDPHNATCYEDQDAAREEWFNVPRAGFKRIFVPIYSSTMTEDVKLETGERVVSKTSEDNLVAKADGSYKVVDNNNNSVAEVKANNDADAMKKYSTKQFNEEKLDEGPLKKMWRGIQNKFDPDNAVKRTMADTDNTIKKQVRSAQVVLARDFDISAKNNEFYPAGEYFKAMDWNTWRNTFGSITDVTDPKYAQWYNAIVTKPDGTLVRRGAEDMRSSHQKMEPGYNTKLVDAYSWDASKAEAAVKAKEEKDKAKQSKMDKKKGKNEEPVNEPQAEVSTNSEDETKKKLTITADDVTKFTQLAQMTGMQVIDQEGNVVKDPSSVLTIDNVKRYSVKAGPKATYYITQWIKSAKSKNLMEKMIEEKCINERVYSYEVGPGDLIDFGAYGELYVCDPNYSDEYYWVTDVEKDRYDKHAQGWTISKDLAIDFVEEDDENLDEDYNKSYDFIYGDSVIEGMFGNMEDSEFERNMRELKQTARVLGLKKPDDLVCYIDSEWYFDPTVYDNSTWMVPEVPTKYTVDGIELVAQTINSNLWLYFSNESDGKHYLDYVSANI